MATIRIDNLDYHIETFSETARQHLQMRPLTDAEIQRLQLSIAQTARIAYANALKQPLPLPLGDAIPTSVLSN